MELCRTVARKSSIRVFTFVQGDLTFKILVVGIRVISIWGASGFVWGD